MNPDPIKPAWQAQPRPAIDAEQLLAEVRRDRQQFAATLFWRDVREVGLSLLMVPLWFYLGAALALPWTWYLMVPTLVWYAGFFLADRLRYPRRPPDSGQPLVRCVKESLAQVEHQVWLLRNVGWWGLLPFAVRERCPGRQTRHEFGQSQTSEMGLNPSFFKAGAGGGEV